MQESFTEEPFKALMVAGAMTSMPNPVGAATSTESKSRDADELERDISSYPTCKAGLPIPPCTLAGCTELNLGPGIAFQAHPRTDHARTSQDWGSPAQQ